VSLRYPVSLEPGEPVAAFAHFQDAAAFAGALASRSPTDQRVLVHDTLNPHRPVSATRGRVPHHRPQLLPDHPGTADNLPFGFHPAARPAEQRSDARATTTTDLAAAR